MFNMPILNIVISLIFLFLLYSLFATSLKEGIATILGLRARMLEKAIVQMLENDPHKPVVFIGLDVNALWKYIAGKFKRVANFIYSGWHPKPKEKIHQLFYDDTIIRNFCKTPFTKPSYISAENFSRVIVDLIHEYDGGKNTDLADKINGSDILDDKTKKMFGTFLVEAGYDTERFRDKLEGWYNDTMDRVSGWYKRQAQIILFLIGLTLAISFNIDVIRISQTLSNNTTLQTTVANMATDFSIQHKNDSDIDSTTKSKVNKIAISNINGLDSATKQQIGEMNGLLGLGWTFTQKDSCMCEYKGKNGKPVKTNKSFIHAETITLWQKLKYIFSCTFANSFKCISFILFAIAISLGAPFWFDLLNNLVNLRAAGKVPDDKTDSKQTGTSNATSVITTINQSPETGAIG
jgi:hypothetical protein